MDSEELGWPLNYLIPKMLAFFNSPNPKIRYHAIHCINQFITSKPNALMVNLNAFIQVTSKETNLSQCYSKFILILKFEILFLLFRGFIIGPATPLRLFVAGFVRGWSCCLKSGQMISCPRFRPSLSSCFTQPRTRMKRWLWRHASFGSPLLSNPMSMKFFPPSFQGFSFDSFCCCCNSCSL